MSVDFDYQLAWRERLVRRYTPVIIGNTITTVSLAAQTLDGVRGAGWLALGSIANGLWMLHNQRRLERQITALRRSFPSSRARGSNNG